VSHSVFLTLCRATPFRPFRVYTHDQQAFDIGSREQVGISPGERMIIVVISDARFEMLIPERIARCEIISEATAISESPAAAPADPELSPGGISFMAFTGTDGRRLVHFAASDADENPVLSSAGTRWDIHGMETFENGRTLYLHHADELTLMRRVIFWPPDRATFDSFAEAMSAADLQRELHEQSTAASSVGFNAPKSYFKSIKPKEPYVPPMPRTSGREDGLAPDDPNRFVMSSKRYHSAPGQTAIAPAVTDLFTDQVMFDLLESGWDASIEDDIAAWDLTLRTATEPGRELKLRIDAREGLALVGNRALPLEAAERHLRNFPLHCSWDALQKRLMGEPRDLSQPEVVFGDDRGTRLEFWPGKSDVPPPFLTIRITDSSGRAILDARGSQWGALARVFQSGIVLNLIHADEKIRLSFKPRLILDLSSHRVASDEISGSTCLAVLQQAIHKCRTPEWMLEELSEWFAKGKDIPVP
jgi:hypothetical protein